MTIWYVHRRADKTIASAHEDKQAGYAEEALDDAKDAEIIAFFDAIKNPVPNQVSAAQMIRALDAKKIYDDVDTAIKNIGGLTSLLWARAPFFERSDPLMVDAAKALGMSDADLDDLFHLAAKL